jgi:hypothetical protein
MTDHHITPTPEIVQQWVDLLTQGSITAFTTAAQWGADQELEACCEWLSVPCPSYGRELRNARRPTPPSLKEQALGDLESLIADLANHGMGFKATNIRRALEQLDD